MISNKDISVVVQGAVGTATPECLTSVRRFLPGAEIILSTWAGADTGGLDFDILVQSPDPGGIRHDFAIQNVKNSTNNFNRQLLSTNAGLAKATRSYALKLRSDLILQGAGFLAYWDLFPARNRVYSFFKHRALCGSLYAREHSDQYGNGFPLPFHPTDFWFFGFCDDLRDYFDCPQQTATEGGNWAFKYPNRVPYATQLWRYAPEQYFCLNWVKKHWQDVFFEDWSDWNAENIELSNQILYNNFIFLGYRQTGIYSPKYLNVAKKEEELQGLISYQRFQEQYKNYCDQQYVFHETQMAPAVKLRKHTSKLLAPAHQFIKWLGQFISVGYYAWACLWRRKF